MTLLARIERYTISREPEGLVVVMDQQEQSRQIRLMFFAAAVVVPLLWLWAVGNRPVGWIIAALSAFMLLFGIRMAGAFASYRERWVITPRSVRVRRDHDVASATWLMGAVGVRARAILPAEPEGTVALRDARLRLLWRVDRRTDPDSVDLIHLDVLDASGAPSGQDFQFMAKRSAETFVEALRRGIRVEVERPGSV